MPLLPLVSIVVPTFNRKADLLECLSSVFRSELSSAEVIVVDNGSIDGTSEAVSGAFPAARIVRSSRNLGVTGGRNLGASLAIGELLLFLDHDTIVGKQAIAKLMEAILADSSIGVAGAAILRHDSPELIWALGTTINSITGRNRSFCANLRYSNRLREILDVPIVPTAFMVPKNVFELVDGFDDAFFATYEDSDFCFRARKLGYRVVCVTKAQVWSKVERPSAVPPQLRNLGLENSFRAFYIGRNRILFMKRHASPLTFPLFAAFLLPAYLLYFATICSLHRREDILIAFLKGTVDGLMKKLSNAANSEKQFQRRLFRCRIF